MESGHPSGNGSGARVLLVRHGESVANTRPDRTWGRSNSSPLTRKGREQSTQLGLDLTGVGYRPDVVYSSPAARTAATAEFTMAAMGCHSRVRFDERLQELDQGLWTGRLREQVYTPQTLAVIARQGVAFAAPGGESMRRVGERMMQWLLSLESEPDNAQVLVFAHGMATRCLAGLIEHWDQDRIRSTPTPNTSLTRVTLKGDRPRIDFLGESFHEVASLVVTISSRRG